VARPGGASGWRFRVALPGGAAEWRGRQGLTSWISLVEMLCTPAPNDSIVQAAPGA